MSLTDKKPSVISDFTVLFFIASILVIDFLPYFKTIEIIHPQFLYLSVINVIMGLYFYFSPKDIINNSFAIVRKNRLALFYLVFVVLCGVSVFAAKNVSLVFTNLTEIFIVFILFINLSILLKDKLSLFYKIVFIVCISTFLQSFNELYDVYIQATKTSIYEGLGQLKWKTGNINILAASMSIKIPFLLLGITQFSGYKKWFVMLTLFLASTAIILTGARSGLINIFLAFSIYIIYLFKTSSFSKTIFLKVATLLLPLVISIVVSNLVFEKTKNITDRYTSVVNRIEQIKTNDASAQMRLTMWGDALKLWNSSPILGIGLGNYRIESIPYESTTLDSTIVSLHAHNDFLEILSETGLINAIIYLALFVSIFFISLKRIIKPKSELNRTIALITLLLVVVYGVDSMFNFPMYRPTMQIFMSLMFALTVVNSDKVANNVLNPKMINPSLLIVTISLVSTLSAYIIFKASNLEYLIKTDDINVNVSGALNGDEVIKRLPLYPNVFGSSESYVEYAGIYYFREKNYDKAIKYLNMADKINPYLGRVDFYKHLIFEEKGNVDSSYYYAKKAFYWRPKNVSYYNKSINVAALKKDTLEILKENDLFAKYTNSALAWKQAGQALQNAEYSRKGLDEFMKKGLKVMPKDSVLIRQQKDFMVTDQIIEGQKYASLGNPDKSLACYKKALEIDPGNIYAFQNIGFHYFNNGQTVKAIDYFQKALKKPGLYDGHTEYYIAISYMKLNNLEKACEYFKLAKERNYPMKEDEINRICR